MNDANTDAAVVKKPFPRSFWTANVTELFERGAYYSMASFVVIYLMRLGLGDYWPSTLNGLLWGLVYFLPILSGTIADQVGFKKALLVAFVLLAIGYFMMGFPVWIMGHELPEIATNMVSCDVVKTAEFTAGAGTIVPIVAGIILIGAGGSVIKPCISGTVQKTAGAVGRATLGFGIFYMVINIGSICGRVASLIVRTRLSLSFIYAVAVCFSIVAFFAVLLFYTDPEKERGESVSDKPRKSIGKILTDMILVLKNKRFAMFLIVSSGFFFLYAQVYNVLPMYLEKVVEVKPPVDVYTMANPITIVCFQLLITYLFGKLKPIKSIIVGIIIVGLSMAINIIPIFMADGVWGKVNVWIAVVPIGSAFLMLTVAMIAFGELFTSARTYEYIGALAPKGQEGLFLGYANLPMAIGSLVGGPVGAFIFNEIMLRDAPERTPPGCLFNINPKWAAIGWLVLMCIGFASALSMWLYNRWIQRHPA